MSQPDVIDSLTRAHAEGRLEGSDLRRSARDCPYLHDRPVLRGEWLRGFGEGRIALNDRSRIGADGVG